MARTLIVAEKPSVGRDIARVLGVRARGDGCMVSDTHVITWAIGHLITLAPPDAVNPAWKKWRMDALPMLPENIPLIPVPSTEGQYNIVKGWMLSEDIGEVICATDAGREGELIFRYIYIAAGCTKPIKRLWLSSMTDEAIKTAFATIKDGAEYDNLYQSARARSEADWLVGMNGSRAFTLRYDDLLSVGRVQTPTLSIIVRRDAEIDAFVPEEYWELRAKYPDFTGLYNDAAGQSRIKTKAEAEAVTAAVRGKTAVIETVQSERKSVPPPLLYDLTTLQREANKKHGFTAQRTLAAAQKLYEQFKAVTYPRTDSRALPQNMHKPIEGTLRALRPPYDVLAKPVLAAPLPMKKRIFDDSKITDHHAIVPTKTPPGNLPPDEQKIYDMVVRRLLEAFYPDYVYQSTKVTARCEGHAFVSAGRVVLQMGWRSINGEEKSSKNEDEQALPPLEQGDTRPIEKTETKRKATKPPSPHNDASLLDYMEHAGRDLPEGDLKEALKESGLGTPATRAAIIERLIQVGYVERKGKQIRATDKGIKLIAVVPIELSSPETTGKWERGLERIRQGKMESTRFMESIRRFCAYLVQSARQADRTVRFERKREGTGETGKPEVGTKP